MAEAGTTTAALFLRKFVDPALSWVHIDMSGLKDMFPRQKAVSSLEQQGMVRGC